MKIDRRVLTVGFPLLAIFAIGGCGGSSSPPAPPPPPPPPPPDVTAPTVSSVQVPAGAVNRIVTLTLTATDNIGVTDVRFFVDGVLLGNDVSAPYSIDWDTSGETEGDHVLTAEAQDAAGNIGQSAAVTATVANMVQFTVALSGVEEVPAAATQATAQASLMVNLATGGVQGNLTITGLTATAAHIHDGFAGTNGPVLVGLDQDAMDPSFFTVPAGAMLDAAGVDRLLAGALYVNVHTAANPGGEIRGQILPDGFVLRFTDLAGSAAAPRVGSVAGGRAAVTLDQVTGALVVQAQVEGLADATQAHVHEAYAGASGPVLVPLSQDVMDPGHWFAEGATLNAAGLVAFAAGQLYVNIHSPANPAGEIRGQILPQGITVLFAELSGEQEVPLVATIADGLAALTFDQAGALLTLHANTNGLNDATGAHLHLAFGGVTGPVEIGLMQDGSDPAHWFAEEVALSAAQLAALLGGETYVNVHSPANPGGEIRGQVIPDGIIFALGHLEGSQRVPVVNTAAAGTFAITADPVAGTLVAHANTSGADDATAAHLHDGYAGLNGAVAIALAQDPGNVARWSAVGVAIDANQLTALRAGRLYVNIHTPANPGGEIRGQVAPPPVEVLFTSMSGDQEVPALASAASAIAATTVDRDTGTVTLHLNGSGADDATGAHIHLGYAGQNGAVQIALQQDATDAGHWSVSGAQLDGASLIDYLAGRLYVNLHTPANAGGEIRGQIAPPPVEVLFTTLSGGEEVPAVVSAASGIAATTVDRNTGIVTLNLNASGVADATGAHMHTGSAGQNGPVLIALQQDALDVGHWSVTGARLDSVGLADYRAGQLYVNLHTPANPGGEIRGQVVPPNAADFDSQAPTVTLMSPGAMVSGNVTLDAGATDNQGIVAVRFLADGVLISSDATAPYSIIWDTTTVANGQVTLTAEAEDLAGNVGVSAGVVVTVQNAAPVTLTQIQAQVFGPTCSVSGCHSGGGAALPTVMNLTSAQASFDNLVNVPSIQVGSIDRIEPGDPDNSYLIRKIEGTAAVGDRMPFGGPFLDPATINMIRQWVSDGALNN
ncbi:MAG: CHRD domain-containing protein [Proteobacteria bacterium]|nr:CHRD domain-containing protein [Pseudomonadota bacterium]